jgi:hypothetical protein
VIQGGPFPSVSWDLLPVSRTQKQLLFHQEGCSCTTEVFVHHPGPSDFEGLEHEARQVENKRHYANQIQVAVDAEFNRAFALARVQEGYCVFAQGCHHVWHYCRLSCNTDRTEGGSHVGQLIHPQAYDSINLDSLRWIFPTNWDRAAIIATRLSRIIVDHCIHRLNQLRIRVPRVLGGWGVPFDFRSPVGTKYLLRLAGSPRSDPPVRFTIEDISWRRFLASDFTNPGDYPSESTAYLEHLVKYQDNDCTDPLGHLPRPRVHCECEIIRFEDIDHYAV